MNGLDGVEPSLGRSTIGRRDRDNLGRSGAVVPCRSRVVVNPVIPCTYLTTPEFMKLAATSIA